MKETAKKVSVATTSHLIEHLENDGQFLDLAVIEELSLRPEAVPALRKVIETNNIHEENWPVIHAVHTLSLIKTPESLQALIYAVGNRHEELSDFLNQTMPGILAKFGPNALRKLERAATHQHLDFYARGALFTAIAAIAWRYEAETREKTIRFLKNVVETNGNKDAVTQAVYALGNLHDRTALPCIKEAFEKKLVDKDFVDEQTAIKMAAGIGQMEDLNDAFEFPITYFTRRTASNSKYENRP